MFEIFNDHFVQMESFSGKIKNYNPDSEKFVVTDDFSEDEKILGEVSLFQSRLNFDLHYWNNWKEKLHSKLLSCGEVEIVVQSTESTDGDSWSLTIYRNETKIDTSPYSQPIEIVNYVIAFCDSDVCGTVLATEKGDKEFELFSEWIEEQTESVSEFNNSDAYDTFESIVWFEGCFTEEEENLICKWRGIAD